MWFYKNGLLITQGDVVTGTYGSDKTRTPVGIYKIDYKEKNATLKGEDYAAPVEFWLPFNGGIGIHDASWRNAFGGELYKTGGSHGCINSPYDVAKTIFDNIEVGTPVICY
jgi:lipoprotein-anchoring transpeptidase ErfK/SrfK